MQAKTQLSTLDCLDRPVHLHTGEARFPELLAGTPPHQSVPRLWFTAWARGPFLLIQGRFPCPAADSTLDLVSRAPLLPHQWSLGSRSPSLVSLRS